MTRVVTVETEVELDEEEKTYVAREAVRLTDKLDRMEEEFKDSRSDWRRRIKDIKTKRDELNKAFMVGTENRKIECVESFDLDCKKALYHFEGKLIKERDLSMDELAQLGTQPMFEEPSQDEDIHEVMREETKASKKRDLVAS